MRLKLLHDSTFLYFNPQTKEPDFHLTPSFPASGKWDSNPRPSAWEADALPLSYSRFCQNPVLGWQI